MKEIPRHRILELISDRKYHSAFLTTYAFDFAFFETTIMRQLKAKHLVNINVLADYNQLHEALGVTTGFAKSISRGYTITGIHSRGAFHPKLYLFIGEKEGAFIIGSGNITPSGFGRNTEIWGAFHINGPEDSKSGMFMQAWEYIKSRLQQIPGSVTQRIHFAEQNASWLRDIPLKDSVLLDDNSTLYFLYNNPEGNTIATRIEELITGEAKEIVIVSPFYDKDLSLTERFLDIYKPERIKIIMPSEGALLPEVVPNKLKHIVSFSKWEEVYRDDPRRLHAKIMYFGMDNGDDFFLFGSTNATLPALGYNNRMNDEVALLIKNPGQNILSYLGFPETLEQSPLSAFRNVGFQSNNNQLEKAHHFVIRLLVVEQEENEFRLFVEIEQEVQDLTAKIFDSYGEIIDIFPVDGGKGKYVFSTGEKRIFNGLYMQLYQNEKPVSNKQIIQELREIFFGNPSKDLRRIEETFSMINSGGDPIELLDYIIFEDEAESNRKDQKKEKTSVIPQKETSENEEKEYTVLPYEEITKEEERDILLNKYKHLMKPEVRILDFLLSYIYQSPPQEIENSDSDDEETDDVDKSTGKADEEKKGPANEPLIELQAFNRITSKLKKHLLGYAKHLRKLAIQAGKQDPIHFLDIKKEYSKFIIVTHFLLRYGGLFRKVRTKNINNPPDQKYSLNEAEYLPYLAFSGKIGDYNFKSLVIDILGDFLWILLKLREPVYKQSPWVRLYKKDALVNALLCIALLPYNEDREKYKKLKDILFLNTIEYIGDSEITMIEDEEFKKKFQLLIQKTARKNEAALQKILNYYSKYKSRYQHFKNEMGKEPAHRKNIVELENISVNDIIFSSKYGFCGISSLKEKLDKKSGTILFRPGLHDEYNDDPFLSEPLPNLKFITL
ncbi:MAG: hypothetical protein J7L73_07240 [Anaerolineales bacterium]|nr:hypothetical protein [Anaerolineales bacterium]